MSYLDDNGFTGCGRCHTCGTELVVSEHTQYCMKCNQTKNYRSHTGRASGDMGPCPREYIYANKT